MDKDNNNVIEWVKKHTVGLLIIVEENWNTMFVRICKDMITEEGMNAAQLLVGATALPYTGGDEVWFLINAFSRVKMKGFLIQPKNS
ncbi:hypothetical protein Sjap_018340 [Stephania japonica]|uniref:Uncharacterized protein n=1 Tax=Stephania japonica TaxID=461633 RepID=A0AAP0I7Y0_9MAGN